MARTHRTLGMLLTLLAAAGAEAGDLPRGAEAAREAAAAPPDAEFLEFLGIWDGEEDEWMDYLAAELRATGAERNRSDETDRAGTERDGERNKESPAPESQTKAQTVKRVDDNG